MWQIPHPRLLFSFPFRVRLYECVLSDQHKGIKGRRRGGGEGKKVETGISKKGRRGKGDEWISYALTAGDKGNWERGEEGAMGTG